MQNIDQVFLYMKDEIERQAKSEEQAILNEVKALEDEAYESMKAEAKRDADLKLKQEEEEMSSNASAEISESHIERTKKLIEKRDEYVKTIFDEAPWQNGERHLQEILLLQRPGGGIAQDQQDDSTHLHQGDGQQDHFP